MEDSSFFIGCFITQLQGTVMVPADLKQLVGTLTEPTDYQMWEINWKKLLKNILPELLNDTETATDNNGDPISLKHLFGEGTWETGDTQETDIPAPVLEKIKDAAQKAFFCIQPPDPLPPYQTIFQSPNESYCNFISKLSQAIELQIRRKQARIEVLEEFAFSNANDICKTSIMTLPHDNLPTLQQMMQVCNEKVQIMEHIRPQSGKRTPAKAIAAVNTESSHDLSTPQTLAQKSRSFQGNTDKPCTLCGQTGHWCQRCPVKKEFDQFRKRGVEGGKGEDTSKPPQKN